MSSIQTIKQIDSWLNGRFKADAPGIAVIVVQDGKTLFRKGYGMANVELGVPIRPDHVFRIGSITKQFTAVAILMLMERGKLALDDRITKFVPRYPTHGHKITIEHLLTHTSGIKNYTDMPEQAKISKEDRPLADQIAFFKDQPMEFKPGERWSYSNSGYLLLGAVIEKVSGQSYEAFLQRHIFDRLGMADTHYDMLAKIIHGRAAGYSNGAAGLENAIYISMTQPHAAGALASSVDDLAKWDAALYTDNVLKQRTLKRAWTSHVLKSGHDPHYGYGWGIMPVGEFTLIEHGGGLPGFSTFAVRVPERRLFVAALNNTSDPALDPGYVAESLALRALGKLPRETKPVAIGGKALARLTGKYKMDDEGTLTLSPGKSRLLVQYRDGMPPLEFFAATLNEFFMNDSFVRLRLAVSDDGKSVTLYAYDKGVLIGRGARLLTIEN